MKTITLTKENVKYIYPTGAHPEIIEVQDGFLACKFKAVYPERLAIFTPTEFPQSKNSHAYPMEFESSFLDLDSELKRFSRDLEFPIESSFYGHGVEFSRVRSVYSTTKFTLAHPVALRFDWQGIKDDGRAGMFCRMPYTDDELFRTMVAETSVDFARLSDSPITTDRVQGPGGKDWLYWIMPFSDLFSNASHLAAYMFTMATQGR